MSRHNLVLYHYWRSSCSWRIRWALAIKQLKYQPEAINLLKGEQRSAAYLAKNPSGTVPCLEIDGTIHTQSLSIIEWLDENYPGRPILPIAPVDRMKARELALVVVADTQPLQNLAAQHYYSSDPSLRSQYAKHWIERGLSVYEKMIQSCSGTFSIGGEVTLADLCLVPQVYNALRFNVDLNAFPIIQRIYANALKTSECDSAAPHNQPGAEAK